MRSTFVLLAAVGSVAIAAACSGGSDGAGGGAGGDGGPPPGPDAGDDSAAPVSLCPNGVAVDRPPGPYGKRILATLDPDVAFDGPDGPIHIKDYFEPCAARSRMLVLRTGAAWCGSCIWSITHTNRLFGDPAYGGGRLEVLDLLVADEDNMPADSAAATRWRARIDAPGKVAIDPAFTFNGTVLVPNAPLPQTILVDTRTLVVRNALAATNPEDLQDAIAIELADLDKTTRPNRRQPALYDATFTDDQADMIRDMKLVDAPPVDATNEYGDVPAAAAFGNQLFGDGTLSPAGKSCNTCHEAGSQFQDGVPQSTGGVATVDRNSPDIALASHARWQFWDGRADTLWMQALGPPENPKEIGSSRLFIAHQIRATYGATYDAVFGAKYPLPANLDTLPAEGRPGDPAYDAMAQADKDAVTRVYVNVGKAIAAYERAIRVQPNRLDGYAGGLTTALSPAEKKALKEYFIAGCQQCHWGPRLTDDAFHVTRFPTGRQDGAADRGRIDVLAGLATAEFNALSKWSDAPSAAKPLVLASTPSMLGAFKTPSLRGAPRTAPFGHGGTLAQLTDVVKHYGTQSKNVGPTLAVGTFEPWIPEFDTNVQSEMPAFLGVLFADPVP